MTPELVAILGVGVTIVTTVVVLDQRTDRRLKRARLERQTSKRMARLEQRQARLEGMLDGLREALFERAARQN